MKIMLLKLPEAVSQETLYVNTFKCIYHFIDSMIAAILSNLKTTDRTSAEHTKCST